MPTVEELKELARENDLSGYSDLNKEELEGLLRDNGVGIEDDDDDAQASATPGTDGVTPIPVDPTDRPASPTAAPPLPGDQPGVGRPATEPVSALPDSIAKRNKAIREGKD